MEQFYPFLKQSFFIVSKGDVIQIGVNYGMAFELDNKNGEAEYMLRLCDGCNTINEIADNVSKEYESISYEEVEEVIIYLYNEGVLKNKKKEDVDNGGSRYSRQISFFDLFTKREEVGEDIQSKIRSLKIALIGLGGGGNNLAQCFASMGVGKIIGADFDNVEISNFNRQVLFREGDIGRPKVEAMEKRLHELNPDVEYEFFNEKIDSIEKVKKVIKKADLVVCTADGPVYDIYTMVDEACEEMSIPWISFGVVENKSLIGPFVIPGKTMNYREYVAKKMEENPKYLDLIKSIRNNESQIRERLIPPSFLPMFMTACGFVAADIFKYVSGFGSLTMANAILEYDILSGDIYKQSIAVH